MRFSTTSKELGEILVNMNRVINNKCTMPILYDIIFELKEDNLSLKGYNRTNIELKLNYAKYRAKTKQV